MSDFGFGGDFDFGGGFGSRGDVVILALGAGDHQHLDRPRTPLALFDFEPHAVPFPQELGFRFLDIGTVQEDVAIGVVLVDEPVPLFEVIPLDGPGSDGSALRPLAGRNPSERSHESIVRTLS